MSSEFEIYDDDQHRPQTAHLYLFEIVGASKLMKSVAGTTGNRAASALQAEITRMTEAQEAKSGVQTRCVAVWLHGAYKKDAIEAELDKQLAPRVLVRRAERRQ